MGTSQQPGRWHAGRTAEQPALLVPESGHLTVTAAACGPFIQQGQKMSRTFGCVLAVLLIATGAWAQDLRGEGLLNGKVVDEQGKGIPNVRVRALYIGTGTYLEAKSDKNGEWSVENVAEGSWEVNFDADGYHPAKVNTDVDESGRSPSLRTTLKKIFNPNDFIKEQGAKAEALMKKGDAAGARALYEAIIEKVPEVKGQMQEFLARTYYNDKPRNLPKAIECMKAAMAADPQNVRTKVATLSMLLEAGSTDEALQMAKEVGDENLDDSIFTAFGITMLNQKKFEEATAYFDKAIAKGPKSGDPYYYRARAQVEVFNAQKDPKDPTRMERMKKIQADLQQYLKLSPKGAAAADAKNLLDQLAKMAK
jgi:tetratricopeptide (TPR) repeat protein